MASTIAVKVAYKTEKKIYNTEFNIYANVIEKIIIHQKPNKTAWRYYDTIDYTGLVVYGVYGNGDTTNVTSQCTITPRVFNGEQSATIKYGEHSCILELSTIIPTRLKRSGFPTTETFVRGTAIKYADMNLAFKAYYADGSSRVVTDKCVFDPADGTIINSLKIAKVSYTEGKVTVKTNQFLRVKTVTSVTVNRANSTKTNIRTGETADYSKVHFNVNYSDGTSETVDNSKMNFSVRQGSKLTNAKQQITASYTAPDGETYTLILNDPIIQRIEIKAGFFAPKTDNEIEFDCPAFTVGFTEFRTSGVSHFIQGTLIPYYITFGTYSNGAYTEDADGDKIGKYISINPLTVVPITPVTIWLINPETGKWVGSKVFRFSYNPPKVSYDGGWGEYRVWGQDAPTWDDYVNLRNLYPAVISAHGPVYYNDVPGRDIKAIEPIIKDGKLSWKIKAEGIYPNIEGETEEIIDTVDAIDEETAAWLKLTESPSNLIEVKDGKAVFEYLSGGELHRAELDISQFHLPIGYNTCTGIYTYGNTKAVARDSQTTERTTEVLHVVRFSSAADSPTGLDYYVTLKTKYEGPIVETVALHTMQMKHKVIYEAGDNIDYRDAQFTATYTDGSTETVSHNDVSLSPPQGTQVTANTSDSVSGSYTNEAGETATVEDKLFIHKMYKLTVTPPTKIKYSVHEAIDWTGFKAEVEYADGRKLDVTNNVYVSHKALAVITLYTEPTVTVRYTEGNETLTSTFDLDLTFWGIYVRQYPYKMVYRLGDTIDYTGIKILSTGSIVDKNDCNFSVKEGTTVIQTTDENIEISYEKAGKKYSTTFNIYIIGKDYGKLINRLEVVSPPNKVSYIKGEKLNFDGLKILCHYKDSTSLDITRLVRLNAESGATVDSNTPRTITAKYSEELSGEFSVNFALNLSLLDRLVVTAPTRRSYEIGNKLRYSDMKAVCYYTDGSYADVSDKVQCSPAKNTKVTAETSSTVYVRYIEAGETVSSSFTILI